MLCFNPSQGQQSSQNGPQIYDKRSPKITRFLFNLYQKQIMCDVVVLSSENQIGAHRLVLGAASEVLNRQFNDYGLWQQQAQQQSQIADNFQCRQTNNFGPQISFDNNCRKELSNTNPGGSCGNAGGCRCNNPGSHGNITGGQGQGNNACSQGNYTARHGNGNNPPNYASNREHVNSFNDRSGSRSGMGFCCNDATFSEGEKIGGKPGGCSSIFANGPIVNRGFGCDTNRNGANLGNITASGDHSSNRDNKAGIGQNDVKNSRCPNLVTNLDNDPMGEQNQPLEGNQYKIPLQRPHPQPQKACQPMMIMNANMRTSLNLQDHPHNPKNPEFFAKLDRQLEQSQRRNSGESRDCGSRLNLRQQIAHLKQLLEQRKDEERLIQKLQKHCFVTCCSPTTPNCNQNNNYNNNYNSNKLGRRANEARTINNINKNNCLCSASSNDSCNGDGSSSDSSGSSVLYISMQTYAVDIVCSFLQFVYTGDPLYVNEGNLGCLLHISLELQVPLLHKACVKHIISSLKPCNASTYLMLVDYYDMKNIRKVVLCYMLENMMEVMQTPDFLKLPYPWVKIILGSQESRDMIACDCDNSPDQVELFVFNTVIKWMDADRCQRSKHAAALMGEVVHLEILSVQQLVEVVESVDWLFQTPGVRDILTSIYKAKLLLQKQQQVQQKQLQHQQQQQQQICPQQQNYPQNSIANQLKKSQFVVTNFDPTCLFK